MAIMLPRRLSCLYAFLLLVAFSPAPLGAQPRELGPDDAMPLDESALAGAGREAPAVPAADLVDGQLGGLAYIVFWCSLAGVVLLVRPLWLRTIYPGRTFLLLGYSAVSACVLSLAINLFTVGLLLIRTPASAAAALADRGLWRSVDWLADSMPLALSLVAMALFALRSRPLARALTALPEQAAGAEPDGGRRVAGATLHRLGRELSSTALFVAVLVAVASLSGLSLALVRRVTSTGVVVLMSAAAVALSAACFLAKSHGILRQRIDDLVPLRAHRRFWRWGTLSLLWSQLLPLGFAAVAAPLVSSAVVLAVGLAVVFVLARGLKAMRFLFGYRRALEQGDTELVDKVPDVNTA